MKNMFLDEKQLIKCSSFIKSSSLNERQGDVAIRLLYSYRLSLTRRVLHLGCFFHHINSVEVKQ